MNEITDEHVKITRIDSKASRHGPIDFYPNLLPKLLGIILIRIHPFNDLLQTSKCLHSESVGLLQFALLVGFNFEHLSVQHFIEFVHVRKLRQV